ncbi:hypothetical protein RD792_012035 [Penstemon davidsonii]|uniref:HSF-type DNA-binding domain-containing protein n=1 Tax=Penstemon davidsonii TaxID=160366 RepID=A0ABR0CVR1_9LAMI|nr:hypothetical protein RD792_012035 [Penstemon davidsonii]
MDYLFPPPPPPPLPLPFPSTEKSDEISPFPEHQSLSPLSFESLQTQFQSKAGENISCVPRPLESLYETPIPPFLSKTFDLVDDPSLDHIISWGPNGDSFVVWDPVEFARMILPKNFKHNNFASFVRQLNTYGFRKIDTDKWEFANEGFIRGRKDMLKNVHRRKSHHSQQMGSSSVSSNEANKALMEDEIQRLRKERGSMMKEVSELQHQQRSTVQNIEMVNEKLVEAEKRQKKMISFLAKMSLNPLFLARLQQTREQKTITSPKIMRKFVKHQGCEPGSSNSSREGRILKYEFEHCNPLHDVGFGDIGENDLAMVHEFLDTPEPDATEPLLKRRGLMSPRPHTTNENFVSYPEDLVMEKRVSELPIPKTECVIAEDDWSMDFETSAGVSNSPVELWGNHNNSSYDDVPALSLGDELSDICDIGCLQEGGRSDIEMWLNGDYSCTS